MSEFTADDVAGMQASAEALMVDSCQIAQRITSQNGMGEEVPQDPEWSADLPCNFDLRNNRVGTGAKFYGKDHTLLEYDAVVRLPVATQIDPAGWIKLTKIMGETVDEVIYDIVSPPLRNASATRLILKRVQV